MIPNNACATRITAAAGTCLAGASTRVTSQRSGVPLRCFFPCDWTLQPEGLHRPRGVTPSRLRALRKILDCSLPKESGQCLSPSVAEQPLSPATHHCLGRRYPTNKLIGHGPLPERKLISEAIFNRSPVRPWSYGVLAPVSRSCPPLRGRLSMYYSPLRRFTRASKCPFSLDLHA